jgi:hypothetical protein
VQQPQHLRSLEQARLCARAVRDLIERLRASATDAALDGQLAIPASEVRHAE